MLQLEAKWLLPLSQQMLNPVGLGAVVAGQRGRVESVLLGSGAQSLVGGPWLVVHHNRTWVLVSAEMENVFQISKWSYVLHPRTQMKPRTPFGSEFSNSVILISYRICG